MRVSGIGRMSTLNNSLHRRPSYKEEDTKRKKEESSKRFKDVLRALIAVDKQIPVEEKSSEINHHLECLRTTSRRNGCREIPLEVFEQLKEEHERTKNGVLFNSENSSEK